MTFTHINLLYGGAILMLVAMVYLRWAMSRLVRAARVAAVVSPPDPALRLAAPTGDRRVWHVGGGLLALVITEKRWPTLATWRGNQLAGTEG